MKSLKRNQTTSRFLELDPAILPSTSVMLETERTDIHMVVREKTKIIILRVYIQRTTYTRILELTVSNAG